MCYNLRKRYWLSAMLLLLLARNVSKLGVIDSETLPLSWCFQKFLHVHIMNADEYSFVMVIW